MKEVADIVAAEITGEREGKYTGGCLSPTYARLHRLAVSLYESRGRQPARHGHDIEDWRCAEQEQMLHYA
jgi:hypothetical protein